MCLICKIWNQKIMDQDKKKGIRELKKKKKQKKPEGWWIRGPMGGVVGERIAMESEIIPPVVKLLFPDIETCGESDSLGRVVRIKFQLLLHRQPKEQLANFYHFLHQFLSHTMVYNLYIFIIIIIYICSIYIPIK